MVDLKTFELNSHQDTTTSWKLTCPCNQAYTRPGSQVCKHTKQHQKLIGNFDEPQTSATSSDWKHFPKCRSS